MTNTTDEPTAPYFLVERFGDGQIFPIDAEQHKTFNEATATCVAAMEIEDLFQIFAQAFISFEKYLLDVTVDYAYAKNRSSEELQNFFSTNRNRFNVQILTLLTSFRSYTDQSDRILQHTHHLPKASAHNKVITTEAYHNHLSYRIAHNLRNYAQHEALPLGGFSIGYKGDIAKDDTGRLIKMGTAFGVSPWLDVLSFSKSKKVPSRHRAELVELGYERIDMKWLIRSFVAAMYKRHAALRKFLKPEVEAAGKHIAAGYELVSASKNSAAKSLELHGNGQERPMRKELADIVLKEFESYTSLGNAPHNYISSKIEPDAAVYAGLAD